MSIDMYLEESQAQAASAKTMAEQEIQAYEDLETVLADFEASQEELKGKAYDSARRYSEQVLRPLVNIGKDLAQAIAQAVQRFPEAYIEQVANESLRESDLERDILELDLRIRNACDALQAMQLDSHNDSDRQKMDHCQQMIHIANQSRRELQEKLDKLRAFHASSPEIFSEIDALKAQLDSGLAQAEKSWDSKTGVFLMPTDKSWLSFLATKTSKTKGGSDKAAIIKDYMQNYDLDKESAESLYKLQQSILKKGKKENWDKTQIIYEFNRIVASFSPSYRSTRWYGVCGTMPPEKLRELCKEYGLSKSEIKFLKKGITDNHEGAANKDLAHEAVQIAGFANQINWPDEKAFGADVASDLFNMGMEKYELSFKGDIDSGRYDDADFNSDLDALNQYKTMRSSQVAIDDVFKAGSQYNEAVRTNQVNRVDEFYKTLGGGDRELGKENVHRIIDTITPGSLYIRATASRPFAESKKDFYDYLSEGSDFNNGTRLSKP